jgi:hypothetical protein
VLWNRAIDPDIDRLAIHPDVQLLYVPTGEGGSANFINVLNASTGDVGRASSLPDAHRWERAE